MVGRGVVDPYWDTMLKRLTHDISTGDGVVGYGVYISTGDDVVEYRTVDLYWGRSSRIWCCRSLW